MHSATKRQSTTLNGWLFVGLLWCFTVWAAIAYALTAVFG